MRDLRVMLATLGCAVLLGACSILPASMTATTVGFDVLEFSRQTQFPCLLYTSPSPRDDR